MLIVLPSGQDERLWMGACILKLQW